MKKTYLLIALCFFCLGSVVMAQSSSGMIITVLDSLKNSPLVGARVTVVSGKDTLSFPTNERGIAHVQHTFRSDKVMLGASFIGYETKRIEIQSPKAGSFPGVVMRLVEEARDMAEIVVVGKAVAVIVKGDTVQFNAEAFKTFANDPMASLFEVLPGMKMERGTLTYLGEPISRLTIDGNRLFGDHLGMAMANIRADDVVDVRVFKEASDQAKLDNTPNPKLHTVVDVRTKSKPTMVRSVRLSAGGGATANPSPKIKDTRSGLYEGAGELIYSRVGKTVSAGLSGGNFFSPSGGILMGEGLVVDPNKDYRSEKTHFLFSREEINKYQFSTNTTAGLSDATKERWESRDYFPTESFKSRVYRNENQTRNKAKTLSTDTKYTHTFLNRNIWGSDLKLAYSEKSNTSVGSTFSQQDGDLLHQQQIRSALEENSFSIFTSTNFSKKLKKGRLNIYGRVHIANQDGDGVRIDTLALSTSQIYLEDTRRGKEQKYDGRFSLAHVLSNTLSLNVEDGFGYTDKDARRIAVDMMTDRIDLNDSYEYRIREFSNRINTSLNYNNNGKEKGIKQMSASLGWEHRDMKRDEVLPSQTLIPRKLNFFYGGLSMKYNFSTFNDVQLSYNRTTTYDFSPLSYMPLDASNPLMVRIANPDLTAASNNNVRANTAFIKGSGTYEFAIDYTYVENSIVDRTQYFAEETYLEHYDYTVMAGSTVITNENLSGKQSFKISGNYDVHAWALQSNIKLGLSYSNSHTPVYVNNQRTKVDGEAYSATVGWIGNFSSILMPAVRYRTSYSDRNNGIVRNEWVTQALTLSLRTLLFSKVELGTENILNWELNRPTIVGIDRFGAVCNLTGSYLFDKQGNLKLSLSVDDLLNKRQRIRGSVEDEYIRSMYSYNLGRYFMLKLQYKF